MIQPNHFVFHYTHSKDSSIFMLTTHFAIVQDVESYLPADGQGILLLTTHSPLPKNILHFKVANPSWSSNALIFCSSVSRKRKRQHVSTIIFFQLRLQFDILQKTKMINFLVVHIGSSFFGGGQSKWLWVSCRTQWGQRELTKILDIRIIIIYEEPLMRI